MGVPSAVIGARPQGVSLPDPGPAERRLIQRLEPGGDEAFSLLYDQHRPGLLRFCQAMLGSREEAEDAVQHAFMSAYHALGRGVRPGVPKTWLYSIARNRCLTVLRARRAPVLGQATRPPEPFEQLELRESLRELFDDLSELPDDQRTALVLSEVSGLSHAEIAAIVGCDRLQVKSLVFQARAALRGARDARLTPCEAIREELSTLRGGALRRNHLRRHLKVCPSCAEFRQQLRRERTAAAAVAPLIALRDLRDRLKLGGGGGWHGAPPGVPLWEWATANVSLLAVVFVAGVGVGAGGGVIVGDRAPAAQPGITARAAHPPEPVPPLRPLEQLTASAPALVRSPALLEDRGDGSRGGRRAARVAEPVSEPAPPLPPVTTLPGSKPKKDHPGKHSTRSERPSSGHAERSREHEPRSKRRRPKRPKRPVTKSTQPPAPAVMLPAHPLPPAPAERARRSNAAPPGPQVVPHRGQLIPRPARLR